MSRLVFSPTLGCLALLGLIEFVSNSPAQCPQSTVSCVGRNPQSDVVFHTISTSEAPMAEVSFGRNTSASYDRVAGTIRAAAYAYTDEAWRHTSLASVVEHFQLEGAAGAWVTIRLTLAASGVTDPSARLAWVAGSARLTARDQTATANTTTPYIDPFIEVSTYMLESEPLEVSYETMAESWGWDPHLTVSGHLEFIGLPAGAGVSPCNSAVPVKPTTWGAVKALYR